MTTIFSSLFSQFAAPESNAGQNQPRLLVPEIVQTSAMDCGPAALKCILEGYGIPASYGRLREACQTDVDGTSINTLEDVARQLGLQVEQMITPVDHLLLPSANLLPALVVTVLPNGFSHFIVAWRVHGSVVQLMDPATGRRWPGHKNFLSQVYRHTIPFPAAAWRAWATSPGLIEPLRQRLDDLAPWESPTNRLIEMAASETSWRGFATLDAATRMVNSLVLAHGVDRGDEATRLIEEFYRQALQDEAEAHKLIPEPYWSAHPMPMPSPENEMAEEYLLLRGAVVLKMSGIQKRVIAPETPEPLLELADTAPPDPPPSAILTAALEEAEPSPEGTIFRTLREDGLLSLGIITCAALLAAAAITLEVALLRGLMVLAADVGLGSARITLLGGLALFVTFLLLLELPIAQSVLRTGRSLEAKIRIAFLEKIPRLGDRYFHSRLISDMAQRAYELHQLQSLPDLALRFLRLGCQLILTTAGIIWLYPGSAPIAILATFSAIGTTLLIQPFLAERDMRVRTHNSALSRFYLDALMGLMPIRTHSAERIIRREHESLLVAWARENLSLAYLQTLAQSTATFIGIGFAIWIVFGYVRNLGEASALLLLLYWALNLSTLGQAIATSAQQYPIIRNNLRRVLEPLGAPEEDDKMKEDDKVTGWQDEGMTEKKAFTLSFENVTVYAGGHPILKEINLTVEPGEHVAIVGPSGAGKSSLVGLLLGWHRPASGQILMNDRPLVGEQLQALRRQTAWVDPSVQLWNRPLQDNLRYGNQTAGNNGNVEIPISQVLEQADLYDVLERLPNGLQTPLGEGGGLVSGGEGQRVRLGRALLRPEVRLAILDEPFRGLDRAKRRILLSNARHQWQAATLLCITHDVAETQDFTRVLVIEEGRIVEDGTPQLLLAQPTSRYRQLLDSDKDVQQKRWGATQWRRLWLEQGRLQEKNEQLGVVQKQEKNVEDELRRIKGIGPVFAERLHEAGIHTLAALAQSMPEDIRKVVTPSGKSPTVKVQRWIEQARVLSQGV